MSSLQKFHRRTINPIIISPFPTIGSGSNTVGYWLGGLTTSKLIVAPISTEVYRSWGSAGTVRNTTSTTDGLANTNTLYAFGSAAHPAAYYCRTLATGGYNTWYLPAIAELMDMYTNKNATPFATSNQLNATQNFSSTESTNARCTMINWVNGTTLTDGKQWESPLRAVRITTV